MDQAGRYVPNNSAARRMKNFRRIFRIALLSAQEQLQYRARIVIWIFVDLFFVALYPAMWLAAYGEREMIEGFTRDDIIVYFVGVAFINVFANFALAYYLSRQIRSGDIITRLLRPFSAKLSYVLDELMHKVTRIVVAIPLIIAALIFFAPRIDFEPGQTAMFFGSLLLGIWLAALFQLLIAGLAFFMDQIESVLWTYWGLNGIFSGRFAPLALFPDWLAGAASILPFRFFVAVPLEAFLGRADLGTWFTDMGILLVWIVVLHAAVAWLWKKGLKRYSAFGQ